MTVFWICASLMIAAALAFVLPPLLGRYRSQGASRDAANLAIYREKRDELESDRAAGRLDEAAFAAACAELDRELLHDAHADAAAGTGTAPPSPFPALVVAVLVPLAAFGAYLAVGTPTMLLQDASPRAAARGQPADAPHSVEEMVARLEQRMREHPEDPDGWVMLGRSYAAMDRLEDARGALEEADRRRPDDPLTLVALAEVLGGLQGNRLDGKPIALVERALQLEPGFPRALWLAGVHAFSVGERGKARASWEQLLATPGLSPEATAQVRDAIARTADDAVAQPSAAPAAQAPARPAAAPGAAITVTVSLAPALASRLDGNETLFVFARAAAGPRMPLAIVRRTARELPLTVTLDDSMAMTPQMKLSGFDRVVVSARVSRSGGATPSSGDLQGSTAPLAPAPGAAVAVVIDEVVP